MALKEGTRVVRTKKKAGIPVGEGFVGRVINALGEPIDGKGAVEEDDYYPSIGSPSALIPLPTNPSPTDVYKRQPVLMPVPLTCYFDIFDGLIQAYVFVFLTALFIKEAIE